MILEFPTLSSSYKKLNFLVDNSKLRPGGGKNSLSQKRRYQETLKITDNGLGE